MIDEQSMKEKFKIKNIFKILKFRNKFNKENPDYFYPDGLTVFIGSQGSGKTLSAVNYVYNLKKKYPKTKIVTDIQLRDYPIITFEEYKEIHNETLLSLKEKYKDNYEEIMYEIYLKNNEVFEFKDNDDLLKYFNDDRGVIFLIDEIQVFMNSLQSKNINMDLMAQISQQRKQRIHIIATCQVFGRMAKPLREQFNTVILCKCILGLIQVNMLINRDSIEGDDSTGTNLKGKVINKYRYIHSPEMYSRYDTYHVIRRNKENFASGEQQKEIYSDINNIDINSLNKKEKKGEKENDKRNLNNNNK